jgi:hypothetical protein
MSKIMHFKNLNLKRVFERKKFVIIAVVNMWKGGKNSFTQNY